MTGHGDAPGLYLLFETGTRPDFDALEDMLSRVPSLKVSHTATAYRPAAEADVQDGAIHWAELLRDGLIFDLVGLAPGPPMPPLEFANRFDVGGAFSPLSKSAVTLWPGSHLSGAENSLPVIRTLLATASDIVKAHDGMASLGWASSSALIGPGYFTKTVDGWLDGGPFPALGLVAFRSAVDGALESVGLSFFTGQELRIEGELGHDRVAATRLAVRLVNELVGAAPVESELPFIGPGGKKLRMEPSANGRFVRVWEI